MYRAYRKKPSGARQNYNIPIVYLPAVKART